MVSLASRRISSRQDSSLARKYWRCASFMKGSPSAGRYVGWSVTQPCPDELICPIRSSVIGSMGFCQPQPKTGVWWGSRQKFCLGQDHFHLNRLGGGRERDALHPARRATLDRITAHDPLLKLPEALVCRVVNRPWPSPSVSVDGSPQPKKH